MAVSKDHYYKLASELPQERLDAAVTLLKELTDSNTSEDWSYALNRLIKGLNTTRQCARYGFSMALTEVVQELIASSSYPLTVSGFMDDILNIIEIKPSMKGKDERAALFGRLFGLQTLINCKIIFNATYTKPADTIKFLRCLLELATFKSWLRETAVFTLCSFIKQLELTDELVTYILRATADLGLTFTSEGVAIYLSIPHAMRVKNGNINNSWKNYDPLAKGNLPTLSKALKDVEVADDDDANAQKQKGSWTPRVHFVWGLVLEKLINKPEGTPPKKKKKTNNSKAVKEDGSVGLREFWKVVVDESFFAEKSSHERKYWGFELFIKAYHAVNYDQVECIITPNFLRCLINQSAQTNRMLNKISVKCLSTIKQESTQNPLKAPYTLACLVDPKHGGCWNFDLLTKSKTTEVLIGCLSQKIGDDAQDVVVLEKFKNVLTKQFESSLVDDDADLKKVNDNIQKWCLNSLLQLIRGNRQFIGSWIEDILNLLIRYSLFKSTDAPNVSINIRNMCQDRLNSILGDIINTKTNNSSWSLYCIKYIRKLEKSSNYEFISELDQELARVKSECSTLLQKVEDLSQDTGSDDKIYSFELLFSMILLQIYMGDEDSFSVVDELKACFESTFSENDGQDVNSAMVMTEIILSFISKKSALLRKFCYIIWESLLCQKDSSGNIRVTDECLEVLFSVLTAKENKEGQKSLFDKEGDFVEDEEEVEDEDDEDDEDDDEDDDESDNDQETHMTDVDKDTNLKLAQALGIPTDYDGEVKFEDLSSDDDDSSVELDNADDEEMFAMDNQLSKIFKERRDILSSTETGNKRKSEVAEAREQMVFIKHRVLDLLDIFCKAQPESQLNFQMIKPLLILINLTLDKNVGTKAHKLLKNRLSKVKLDVHVVQKMSETVETLRTLLEWVHGQVSESKSSNSSHILACNSASILIAKTLVSLDSHQVEPIIDIYAQTMKTWAKNGRSKTQPSLFFDFINWLSSWRK
ncbi:DNA-directed DNA polymerase [Yamadazyma tenuis]|uniref:DNA-directed DNA polymerase n=1 Tax=Candida tenuis TaxID=2315449 RepID=UPI00279802D5|nr:DNA-directed DNA polymerase [Yamadazyma tenuis]